MRSHPIYPDQKYSQENIDQSCKGHLHPKAIAGLQLFNAGEYFEAHEELELAWREERGPVREVYRGVLQIGVAYYHILNNNFNGAVKMFKRAWPWLAPYPHICRGIDLECLHGDARKVEAEILALGADRLVEFDRQMLMPVRFTLPESESDYES
jgi:uncharacterized protein